MYFLVVKHLVLLSLLALGIAACAFRKETPETDDGIALLSPAEQGMLSYAFVEAQVLRRCSGCHGTDGGITLETYPQVKARLADIERTALRTRTMPKTGAPLTPRQLSILKTWIAIGAPEFGSTPTNPPVTPPPPPPPPPPGDVEPVFSAIKEKILNGHLCFDCHTEFGNAEDVPLDTRDALASLVNFNNPAKSRLILAVERKGEDGVRPMPPPTRPEYPPIELWEIEVLREWIRRGAPE